MSNQFCNFWCRSICTTNPPLEPILQKYVISYFNSNKKGRLYLHLFITQILETTNILPYHRVPVHLKPSPKTATVKSIKFGDLYEKIGVYGEPDSSNRGTS